MKLISQPKVLGEAKENLKVFQNQVSNFPHDAELLPFQLCSASSVSAPHSACPMKALPRGMASFAN